MANKPRPDAIDVFRARTTAVLAGLQAREGERPRREQPETPADAVESLLWQVSLGSGLGVLPAEFVHEVYVWTQRGGGFSLPSSVHGVDANDHAVRLFFEFASLEAELTEPELAELVRNIDPDGEGTNYPETKDRPTYTAALIRDILEDTGNVDDDTAAACLEVMSQLLAFEEDVNAFERAVADLPHTSELVKRRFAAVHRAAQAITQHKGHPEPRVLEYA